MLRILTSALLLALLSAPAAAQTLSIIAPDSLGAGLQTRNFEVAVNLSDSQHGGIFVTLAASDSSLALVAPDNYSAGAGAVDQFIPNGTAQAYFVVQGLEFVAGDVILLATAPGFSGAAKPLTIDTPRFRVTGLDSEHNVVDPDDVFVIETGRSLFGSWQPAAARVGGPGLTVQLGLSDPVPATLVTTALTGPSLTVPILGGQESSPASVAAGGVALRALAAGQTDLSVSIGGFVAQGDSVLAIDVTPATITLTGFNVDLGAGLRTRNGSQGFELSGSNHGGVTVRMASADSTLALVSANPFDVGQPFVDIFVPDGDRYGTFTTHALEGVTGIASIGATATGFAGANDGMPIVAPAMTIKNLGVSLDTFDPVDPFTVHVGVPAVAGPGLGQEQPVRPGGGGLDVALVCDTPAVGRFVTSTQSADTVWVRIEPNTFASPSTVGSGGVAFDGLAAGSATVYPLIAGFSPVADAFRTVTVTQPGMTVANTYSYQIGSGLQVDTYVTLQASAHGGVTVSVAIDDPGLAVVSGHPDSVGTGAIDVFVPNGEVQAYITLQAFEGAAGTINISASAPGFAPVTQPTDIVTPAIQIRQQTFHQSTLGTNQTVITPPDEFDALVGIPSGPQSVLPQAARIGGPGYDVTASVDLPAIARFVTASDTAAVVTARIEPGQNQTPATVAGGGFAFDGLTPGDVTVSVSIPGFVQQDRAVQTRTVQSAQFSASTLQPVGSGLVGPINYVNVNGSAHGGTWVTVASADSALALVSADAATPGASSADVFMPDGLAYFTFHVQGLEGATGLVDISFSAPGFDPESTTVDIVTPVVGMANLPASIDINAAAWPLVVEIGTPDGVNGDVAAIQAPRPGGPGVTATVTVVNPAIGEMVDLGGAGPARTITFPPYSGQTPYGVLAGGLGLRGVGEGASLIDATIPGFAQVGTATQEVQVIQDGVALLGFPAALGAGLQTLPLVARLESGAHAGTTVRITSGDGTRVLSAPNATTAGSDTLNVFVPAGEQDAVFHLQALEGATGALSVTALVDGAVVGVRSLSLAVPGVAIAALADSLNLVDPADPFVVQVGLPDADNVALAATQALRAGGPGLSLPVVLDVPGPADLVTLGGTADSLNVTINPGEFQSAATVGTGGVALAPASAGAVTVQANPVGLVLTTNAAWPVIISDNQSPVGLLPAATVFHGNHPNPFNPRTRIAYTLAGAGEVRLDIHDVRGHRVKTLVAQHQEATRHQVTWDGTDKSGRGVAAGVYFVRLVTPDRTFTRKIALVK